MKPTKYLLPIEAYEVGLVPTIASVSIKLQFLPVDPDQPGAPAEWSPTFAMQPSEARLLAARLQEFADRAECGTGARQSGPPEAH